MEPSLRKKWIAALKSGKYKQGRGVLRTSHYHHMRSETNYRYCCLGVLCNIIDSKKWNGNGYTFKDKTNSCSLSPALLKKIGLSSNMQDKLINLNDKDEKNFEEIADYIQRYSR